MGTVTKRRSVSKSGKASETWRVRYVDAEGVRRSQEGFKRKGDADAYLIKVQGELATGIHTPDSTSVTVGQAADLWLAAAEAGGCDRGTLKTYGEIVRGHILPLLGTEKLSRLNGPKVVVFRDALQATRSHSLATKAVRHLSMILGDAVQRGLVARTSPAA